MIKSFHPYGDVIAYSRRLEVGRPADLHNEIKRCYPTYDF